MKNVRSMRDTLSQRSKQSGLKVSQSCAALTDYPVPAADHKYTIKHAYRIGEFGQKHRPDRFMDKVIKRAKSTVDPRKYSKVLDWKKRAKTPCTQNAHLIPQAKKISINDEL